MFTTLLAYAYAGGLPLAAAPVAYSPANAVSSSFYTTGPVAAVAHAAPVAIHAPAVGSSQQTVLRGLGGSQAVSHYSKAVDSAFSSVRKYDTRITNDALRVAHAPVVAAPAYAAHAYAAPAYATHSYAAPAYATHSYAAPAYATQAYAAPAYAAQTYAAPAYATHSYASPVVAHAGPAVVAKSAPVAVAYSPAGLVSHVTFSGYGVNYGW